MKLPACLLLPAVLIPLAACASSAVTASAPAASTRNDPPDAASPPSSEASDASTQTPATHGHTVFLNFDGVDLGGADSYETEDATKNAAFVLGSDTHSFEGWKASQFGTARADVIARVTAKVAEFFAPFDVEVVNVRPAAPRLYSMVVLTDEVLSMNSFGASAGLDCDNKNAANVSVVFPNAILGNTDADIVEYLKPTGDALDEEHAIHMVAYVCSHELGHSMGLEDTDGAADIMFPDPYGHHGTAFDQGNVKDFATGRTKSKCTGKSTQDSRGILLDVLGPRKP